MDTLLIIAGLAFIYFALGRLSKAAAKVADDLESISQEDPPKP
jgi:hypothetical protein